MASQINLVCDFASGYLQCDLPENTVDIDLKIHTIRGIHTYKEDCHSCANRFRPWGIYVMPFEPLKEKMAKFMRQREAATTTTTPSCHDVQPPPNIFNEEVRRDNTKIDIVQSQSNNESRPSKVSNQPIPKPHPEPEQPRPKIWMHAKALNKQATQSKPEPEEDYCDVCTPNGRICHHTWHRFTTHLDIEESNKGSNWDADIEEAGNYRAREPLRRPRQPLKVLVFQPRTLPVRWPCGVRPMAHPASDQMPRSYYILSPPPNENEHEQEPEQDQMPEMPRAELPLCH